MAAELRHGCAIGATAPQRLPDRRSIKRHRLTPGTKLVTFRKIIER
jgi:hypothetical protein